MAAGRPVGDGRCQAEAVCRISRSKVTLFKSYFPDTQTHTHRIDCSAWTTKVVDKTSKKKERLECWQLHCILCVVSTAMAIYPRSLSHEDEYRTNSKRQPLCPYSHDWARVQPTLDPYAEALLKLTYLQQKRRQ